MKLLHSGSGSFNKVIINEVIFDDGKLCNLAVRESKVPVYRKVLKDAGPSVNIFKNLKNLNHQNIDNYFNLYQSNIKIKLNLQQNPLLHIKKIQKIVILVVVLTKKLVKV